MPFFPPHPLLFQLRNFCTSSQSLHPSTYLDSLKRTRSLLLARGRKPNTAFSTKLINACFKAGEINEARKLFEEMPEKNIISHCTVIYGYANNGMFSESLQIFSRMQTLGFSPNSFTIVAALISTAGLQVLRIGESIHGLIIKSGLESDSFVRTAMLDAYAKCWRADNSYRLFKEMGVPSLVSCNAVIAGLVYNGQLEEAVKLFKQVCLFGLVPNFVTMLSVIQGCSGVGLSGLCQSIHGYVVKVGFDLNVSVINSVLDMYLSFGNLEVATDFFQKMDVMDVISWTTMITFLVQLKRATEALKLFCQMRDNGIDPDMVAMVNITTGCALLGCLEKGRLVHNQIVIRGFGSEYPIISSLIAMYSRCGDLEASRIVFDHTMDKSVVSWTAIISGYVQNGQPREGLQLLIRMRAEETYNLDSVTLVSSLTACGELANLELSKELHAYSLRSGFSLCKSVQNSLMRTYAKCGNVDLAHKVFKEVSRPDTISWNAIISGYGINGKGETALSLFRGMEQCGEEPDSVTYLSVLNACSHSGLVDDGLMIFSRMVEEKKINPIGEHCGCVVDMLARAGHLLDASKLVSSMPGEVSSNAWKALLAGCFIHNDVRLAEFAADSVFQMDMKDLGHVVLLSNVYASVGRFEEAKSVRSSIGKTGLMKNPGFSLLDPMPSDFG